MKLCRCKCSLNYSWAHFNYNLVWRQLLLPADTARSFTYFIMYQMNASVKLHVLSWSVSTRTLRKCCFLHLWEKLLVYPTAIETGINWEGRRMQCKNASFEDYTTTLIFSYICLWRMSHKGSLSIACNCFQTAGFWFSGFS